jgi:hypothetical protein
MDNDSKEQRTTWTAQKPTKKAINKHAPPPCPLLAAPPPVEARDRAEALFFWYFECVMWWMGGWTNEWVSGWINEWMDGCDGRMDGRRPV